MEDASKLVPAGAGASQCDRANARKTSSEGSVLGTWWLHAANIAEWIAESDSQSETGRVRLLGAGYAEVYLGDMPGWRPFASLAGPPEGRLLQLTCRYAHDGGYVESSSMMTWDSTLGRYVGLGTTSDGSIAQAGANSRILVGVTDHNEWELHDLVFGWVQLEEG